MTRFASVVFASALLAATSVAANTPLKEVREISEGLIAAGMAIEIGDKCGSVNVRTIRGMLFLNSLKNRAEELGYSSAEVDAYVNDRVEKARLEDIARGRLRDLGAVPGDEQSYCAVGRAEIQADTTVGRLLR